MNASTDNRLDDPLHQEFEHLGIKGQARSAICLSGGGIRSAAFCLGVLQSLARWKVLRKFQYLSTVSGGGYIGSWLKSRLANEEPSKVEKELGENSREILRDLRSASRYLTPRAGVWSLDIWKLIGTYLRNLALNWAVLVPFAVAAAAIVKSVPLLAGEELPVLLAANDFYSAVQSLEPAMVEAAFVLGPPALIVMVGLFAAFVQAVQRKASGLQSYGACWLRASVLWLILTTSVVYGPRILGAAWTVALTVGSGLVTAVASRFSSERTAINEAVRRIVNVVTAAIVRIAAAVFILALIAFFSWLASRIAAGLPGSMSGHDGLTHLYVAGLGFAASAILACVVDFNDYSLHGMYRDRLTEGFLHKREDIALKDLDPKACLFHILNATVNSSKGFSADRMGLPFSFTSLQHGYWENDKKARFVSNKDSELTLGTAMAISGAAANPNMGYFSSALIRFPMALLNLRLGWWLPQPTTSAKLIRASPLAVLRIWKAEFLGITNHEKDKLINVSDGGHFDNLGLYEMVRRRCAHVLVVDAGADPRRQYQDLANVVRRVRIDFGIEITINGLEVGESLADNGGRCLSLYKGTIHYPNDTNGTLVYVRPEPHPEEPMDISAYRARHPKFPHESTVDQWFSEAQFESYRRLGEFTINNAVSFYLNDKGPSANRELLESANGTVNLLAESAYRMSRGVTSPSHAGGILYERSGPQGEIGIILVRSAPNTQWVLPKGHIETGESPEDAAKREVGEETGYRVLKGDPFGIETFTRDGQDIHTAYFLMDITGKHREGSVEKRDLIRLVYKSKVRRKLARADVWSWGAADWESTDLKTDLEEVPKDVLAVLQRAARYLWLAPNLSGPDGADSLIEDP